MPTGRRRSPSWSAPPSATSGRRPWPSSAGRSGPHASPPKSVDLLLMEGSCVGRDDQTFPTEDDLAPRFVDLFRQTPGMPLVWCSGQNIDRIVTIFKACRDAGRQFILDMYTAEMLRATGNKKLPQAESAGHVHCGPLVPRPQPRSGKGRLPSHPLFGREPPCCRLFPCRCWKVVCSRRAYISANRFRAIKAVVSSRSVASHRRPVALAAARNAAPPA
jgi:hypothetical protein